MHTELFFLTRLSRFSATETEVKPPRLSVSLCLCSEDGRGGRGGSSNEASVSMRCREAVSSTHSRPLSPVATSGRLGRQAASQAWRPVGRARAPPTQSGGVIYSAATHERRRTLVRAAGRWQPADSRAKFSHHNMSHVEHKADCSRIIWHREENQKDRTTNWRFSDQESLQSRRQSKRAR